MKEVRSKKIANFRDLGGIPAADGRRIRPGMLFRSGHHARLTNSDSILLVHILKIHSVIDLRSDEELRDKPDRHAHGINYHHMPLLSNEQNPSVTSKTRLKILKKNMAYPGGTKGYLIDCYRSLVSSKLSRDSLSASLKILLENRGATLWHCTQGKDRAGFFTAVVMMALGVDKDEIRQDYLSTNRFCRTRTRLCCLGTVVATLKPSYGKALLDLLSARDEYLDAAYSEIDRLFGGVHGYLTSGLGLTDSDLDRLKDIYLA